MKIHTLFLLFNLIFLQNFIFCQTDTTYSLDGKITGIRYNVDGEKQGLWTTYHENGSIKSIGNYVANKKEGKWLWYHDNGLIAAKEKYKNDNFSRGKFWDSKGKRTDISLFYTNAEYPGGLNAFRQMISENLIYPEESLSKGIHGRVYIRFEINEDGDIINISVLRGINKLLDDEALRVIKLSGKWTPATFHEIKIKQTINIPIVFKLQ